MLALSLLPLVLLPARAAKHPVSVMETGGTPRVLVFTRTDGFRHDSIPTAIEVLGQVGPSHGVSFDFTEDPWAFQYDNLKQYDGLMFVSTSGEVLDDAGKAAMQRFFRSGGSYTGVHLATGCLNNDTDYVKVVGATFNYHPEQQKATFVPLNKTHPATAGVPDRWSFQEEVYFFNSDPRAVGANVILTVDPTSFTNNAYSPDDPDMGNPHPIAWYIEEPQSAWPLEAGAVRPGRSFYTSLGHLNETWRDETFIEHVMGGLTWALDGGGTRAYNAGIVGNQSVYVPPKPKQNTSAVNGTPSGGNLGAKPGNAAEVDSGGVRTATAGAAGAAALVFAGLLAAVL